MTSIPNSKCSGWSKGTKLCKGFDWGGCLDWSLASFSFKRRDFILYVFGNLRWISERAYVQFPVLPRHGIWEANHLWVVRTSSVYTTGCTHVNASLENLVTPKSCTMQRPEIYAQVLWILCFGPNEHDDGLRMVEDGDDHVVIIMIIVMIAVGQRFPNFR